MPPFQPLFWVGRDQSGKRTIFPQRASDKLYAWLRSALAGREGAPVEIHELGEERSVRLR